MARSTRAWRARRERAPAIRPSSPSSRVCRSRSEAPSRKVNNPFDGPAPFETNPGSPTNGNSGRKPPSLPLSCTCPRMDGVPLWGVSRAPRRGIEMTMANGTTGAAQPVMGRPLPIARKEAAGTGGPSDARLVSGIGPMSTLDPIRLDRLGSTSAAVATHVGPGRPGKAGHAIRRSVCTDRRRSRTPDFNRGRGVASP